MVARIASTTIIICDTGCSGFSLFLLQEVYRLPRGGKNRSSLLRHLQHMTSGG